MKAITSLSVILFFIWSVPSRAQEIPDLGAPIGEEVDLELVLAVDISGSVDGFEGQQQRYGYIAALTHPSVINAIKSSFLGKIAVTYVEWADAYHQEQLVDWMIISDEASAQIFAATLMSKPIQRGYRTSISHAIDFSTSLFDTNNYAGLRWVIDISGDGRNNRGRPLSEARAQALARGITINGLPILNDRPQPWGPIGTPIDVQLDLYYNDNVIGGSGAFMVVAEGFEAFRDAILSKLVREIADRPAPAIERFSAAPGASNRVAHLD